jgi:hypothetical protein
MKYISTKPFRNIRRRGAAIFLEDQRPEIFAPDYVPSSKVFSH